MFCVFIDSLCYHINTKFVKKNSSTKICSKFFYQIPSDMILRLLKQAQP